MLECARCGNRELERRSGWFRDEDYHELLADYFSLEQDLAQARAQLIREKAESAYWRDEAKWAVGHAAELSSILVEQSRLALPAKAA